MGDAVEEMFAPDRATSGSPSSPAEMDASRRCSGSPEAALHPHNAARGTYVVDEAGAIQPGVAPRFLATPSPAPTPASTVGADTDHVLRELGIDDAGLAELRERGVVG